MLIFLLITNIKDLKTVSICVVSIVMESGFTVNSTDQQFLFFLFKTHSEGFPGGAVVENLPANAGDTGSSPGLGGSHMLRSS